MYKKIIFSILLCFLIIGAASAASDFKVNDGFTAINEYVAENPESGMELCTWDYDDELTREYYLQNSSDYHIAQGDNNTYNITYESYGEQDAIISYLTTSEIPLDAGVLEIVEVDGKKYIIMALMEKGTIDDWKACYDELMKFNANNNIEPLADAI